MRADPRVNGADMQRKQPFKRADRVGDLMREVISEILMQRVDHQGLEGVTVTGVSITNDLQHARVFYRVLDHDQLEQTAKSLQANLSTIRREVGRQMKLRYTPDLRFEYDESIERGSRIEALLHSIRSTNPPEEE